MKKESALPIRLDTELKAALTEIADATGLSVSALVRMLVKSFVDEYERSGGRVAIPPRWQVDAADYQRDTESADGRMLKVAESRERY